MTSEYNVTGRRTAEMLYEGDVLWVCDALPQKENNPPFEEYATDLIYLNWCVPTAAQSEAHQERLS